GPSNDVELHFRRPSADSHNHGVTVELLDLVLLGKSCSAVDLDGRASDVLAHIGGDILRHGCGAAALGALDESSCLIGELAGGLELAGTARYMVAHGLVLADGPT